MDGFAGARMRLPTGTALVGFGVDTSCSLRLCGVADASVTNARAGTNETFVFVEAKSTSANPTEALAIAPTAIATKARSRL